MGRARLILGRFTSGHVLILIALWAFVSVSLWATIAFRRPFRDWAPFCLVFCSWNLWSLRRQYLHWRQERARSRARLAEDVMET